MISAFVIIKLSLSRKGLEGTNTPVYFASVLVRVTRLGEILPFELLFKGPGENLGTKMVCFLGILRVRKV